MHCQMSMWIRCKAQRSSGTQYLAVQHTHMLLLWCASCIQVGYLHPFLMRVICEREGGAISERDYA